MKILTFPCCALLTLLMSASVYAEDWTPYFPLTEGSTYLYWNYYEDPAIENTASVTTILSTYDESGNPCADVEEIIENPQSTYFSKLCWMPEGLYTLDPYSPSLLLLPKNLAIGETMIRNWGIEDPDNPSYGTMSVTIEELIPSMTVTAGTFTSCIKVNYVSWDEFYDITEDYTIWYALDVGIISIFNDDGNYRSTFELTSYYIPGGPIPPDDHSDTPAGAGIVTVNDSPIAGSIATPGDVDFFKFSAISGTQYTIETGGGMDTYLELYASDGVTIIAQDDDSGLGLLSRIEWDCLSSGTYYVSVRNFSSSGTGNYTLSITATLNELPIVYLDFNHAGAEDGSQAFPYNSLVEAIDRVETDGTIKIIGSGIINEVISVSKALSIELAP